MVKALLRAGIVGWVALITLVPARAVDLRDVLTDFTATAWSRKDGLAGPVYAIAQDSDGFLWVGSDDALTRFDGVRFRSWESLGGAPLPRHGVRALHLSPNGNLWVGFGGAGGVARLSGRTVTVFGAADQADTGAVTDIDHDSAGRIWVAGTNGLFRLAENQWQRLGTDVGLPDAAANSFTIDKAGALWVATMAGIYAKAANSDRFQQVEAPGDSTRTLSLSAGPDGTMWTSDPLVGFRPVGSPASAQPDPQSGRGFRITHDHEGNLWLATIGQGVWRVRLANPDAGPYVERHTVLSGLSSDAVRFVFEDRDGNIWAATTDGLDRLVPHRITPWAGLGIVGTLAASTDGHLWAGTEDELLRFSKSGDAWRLDQTRLSMPNSRMVRADAHDGLWVLTADDLIRVQGAGARRIPYPAGIPVSWTEALAPDRAGGVWVVAIGGTILHDDDDRLQVFDRVDELKEARIAAALGDRQGRLWVAYSGSRVGVLSGQGQFKSFGVDDGLVAGPYYSMLEDSESQIWVASASGLSRFDGTTFTHVTRAHGLPASGVLSLVEANDQHLWLSTTTGIIRLSHQEFEAAAKTTGTQMYYRNYDTSYGLAGFPSLIAVDRSSVRAKDGTLWFVTSRGLSMLDPTALAATPRTPNVTIDEMRADDRPATSASLPAGTAKVEIDYTAPELSYPLKTNFRYRLDGWDSDWIYAGARRQVLYTNLPPRAYSFRVAVSGDEGRWSESTATLNFAIAPRFYQTFWFYPLSALMIGGLIAGAWQLRLRQLRRQFSLVLGERVRLSRELHDTLLQSLVGVALEFDAVSKSLETSPAAAKARVVKIREHVEEYIREARRSIWSLRSTALETGDLVEALRESAERAASNHGVDLSFDITGTPRRLPPQIEHQVLRIGQEAVLNAVRHAKASHLGVTVDYGEDTLVLKLKDDGVGFDPARTAEGTTDHYGIITMRERAQQAGGDVTITSAPGSGTTVEARVPTTAFVAEEAQA